MPALLSSASTAPADPRITKTYKNIVGESDHRGDAVDSIVSRFFGKGAGDSKADSLELPVGKTSRGRTVAVAHPGQARSSALGHTRSASANALTPSNKPLAKFRLETGKGLQASLELAHNFKPIPVVSSKSPPYLAVHARYYQAVHTAADAYYNAVTLAGRGMSNPAGKLKTLLEAQALFETAISDYVAQGPELAKQEHEYLSQNFPNASPQDRAANSYVVADELTEHLLPSVSREGARLREVHGLLEAFKGGKAETPMSISVSHLLELLRSGVTVATLGKALAESKSTIGVDESAAAALDRAGIPMSVEVIDPRFSPKTQAPDSYKKLGAGAISTVYEVRFTVDSKTRHMVFKPEFPGTDLGVAATRSGIPPERPNATGRAWATYLVDQALKTRLVPETAVAVVNGQAGLLTSFVKGFQPMSMGTLRYELSAETAARLRSHSGALEAYRKEAGFSAARLDGNTLVLEHKAPAPVKAHDAKADGAQTVPAESTDKPIRVRLPFSDAGFVKDMVAAQWHDAFNRQVDRNAGNFVLAQHGGNLKVQLIDNPASHGRSSHADVRDDKAGLASRRVGLPPFISRELATAIQAMGLAKLGANLRLALVDEASVKRSVDEAAGLQALVNRKPGDVPGPAVRIIEADEDWLAPEVIEGLGMSGHAKLLQTAMDDSTSKGRTDLASQRNAGARLLQTVGMKSYLAREALEETLLAQERHVLGSQIEHLQAELDRPPGTAPPADGSKRVPRATPDALRRAKNELAALPVMFDMHRLLQCLDTAAARPAATSDS
ncbi:MAG TPA: hypothetical protein VLJ86_11185 [Ramlibacter sp.]|nr:hypothetical protein [Ramlibacter sp.]